MRVTAFARCAWCKGLKLPQFYRGKRVSRCSCDHDYRTPIEIRRDVVLEKYGDDPDAYTPAVLSELAREGLFDLTAAFCPAGKLSMAETLEREAQAIEARSDGTVEQGPARRARARSGTDAPNLSSPSLNKEDGE
jgi:hypothetical protein